MSHRALLLGAIANGRTRIDNLLVSADVQATWDALEALGVAIARDGDTVVVDGVGPRGFTEAGGPIDCANSGTTMRILAGILAGQSFSSLLVGDESLSQRPMRRVIAPLRLMGAEIDGTNGDRPPLRIQGRPLHGVSHALPVASAQVKSCLLLAGLLADGTTSVTEPVASRDHTERLLRYFGAELASTGTTHRIAGGQQLEGRPMAVCGDISSAAFFLVGAVLVGGSKLLLPQVGVNPTRAGVLDVLTRMGGRIERSNEMDLAGEPVADLIACASSLNAVEISGEIIPRLIDEMPVLAVAATQAKGTTVIADAEELRVKETDRIATTAMELRKLGADIEERRDGMVIHGPTRLRGAACESHGDHRIAMALAIAGLVADGDTTIDGAECIEVSFPGFANVLGRATQAAAV